ncbi:MAG TPA: hypothetical protein VN025_07960 [Candidatus Dormibacteraeota bacterium]|nr:hypothetical protein [Candidatus Dormibacteraeota bacterium]
MARKLICLTVAAILVFTLAPIPPVANACGPYLAEAVFTDMKSPDFDYGEYLQGKLGIIQPSYYDLFLFAAYRNLSGTPFTKEELAALNPAMQTNPTESTSARERGAADRNLPIEETLWHKAADDSNYPGSRFPDVQGVIRSESRNGNYIQYYNCLPDAFKTARERLEQHRAQFGTDNPSVRGWLEAQQKVFANCGAPYQFNKPPQEAVIPISASENDPPVIRADRDYQVAAAYFYAGNFSEAAARFEQISKSDHSPWKEIAGYLQARALIRKGTIGDGKGNADHAALVEAEKLLKQILEDPGLASIHKPTQRRLDFVAARLHPEERRSELAQKLTHPGTSADFDQDQTDYFWLLNNTSRAIGAKDDLTNWIFTMKTKGADGKNEAMAQWQKKKSLPWLVAALCKAELDSPGLNDLMQAAVQVPQNSPGYTTVDFHTLRLGNSVFKNTMVVAELNGVIENDFSKLPVSAQNQFLALRMSFAENFEEFLRFAPRKPTGVVYGYGMDDDSSLTSAIVADNKASGARFDSDSATILSERVSLRMLVSAAKNEELPVELQRMVTLAAWTRAVILKNDAVAQDLAPRVVQLAPELKTSFESYFSSKTPEERTFAAAYVMLKSPGLRPFVDAGIGRATSTDKLDNLRDNWWCSFAPVSKEQPALGSYTRYPWSTVPSPLKQIYADGKIPAPEFITSEDAKTASNEFQSLAKLPPAPDWLGKETLAYASGHAEDPRVPEALHLVVRATRLGCTDEGTGKVSKAAWDLLHNRYADNTWAKQTPYWFR